MVYEVGMFVTHGSHPGNGIGEILGIEGPLLSIRFGTNPIKQYHYGIVSINIVDPQIAIQHLLHTYCFEKAEEYYYLKKDYVEAGWYEEAIRSARKRQYEEKAKTIKSKLQGLLEAYHFEEADIHFQNNRIYVEVGWYEEALRNAKLRLFEEKTKVVKSRLHELIKSYQFEEADKYFQDNIKYVDAGWYEDALRDTKKRQFEEKANTVKARLHDLLESYRFEEANEYYQDNKEYVDSDWYSKSDNYYHQRYRIEDLLQKHQFFEADKLYNLQTECFTKEEYVIIKAEQIKLYTQTAFNLDNQLDSQQSQALADISDNMLVTARAGSGKTTSLTCKGMLLAACKYVDNPDGILMLAFNRKAADEIRERINIKHKMPLKNIRTFHSLAHRIVQPTQEINEDYENEMAEHLKILLQDDPRLKPYLYEFFKKEMEDIDYKGLLLNETDYYAHAKYCWQSISLGGDRVKSYGEKCIADFLFEHNLTYKYEKPYLSFEDDNPVIYKPDFAIYDSDSKKTFILEHWAIPEKRYYPETIIWNNSKKTERQYAEERSKKRDYWKRKYPKNKKHILIETDVGWLVNGREEFEAKLKRLLESQGITCNRLPENELLDKVYRNHSNRLFKLFVSFIQKCRRNGYTPESIKEKRDGYITENEKEKVFLKVAPEIFEKYEKRLDRSDKLDFDRLVHLAIEKIATSNGDCSILDNKNNINIKIRDLEYILIDEYQDFSKMFYDIISVLSHYKLNKDNWL